MLPQLSAAVRVFLCTRPTDVNGGGKVQRGAAADGRPKWATPLV
jgi:hypothetical protein